jgi:hypothetical protein
VKAIVNLMNYAKFLLQLIDDFLLKFRAKVNVFAFCVWNDEKLRG